MRACLRSFVRGADEATQRPENRNSDLSIRFPYHRPSPLAEVFPNKLSYQKKDLEPLFKRLDQANMRKFLSSFTAFRTRYYRSETGAQSQKFLLGQVEQIAASNKDLKIDVREFKHPWGQNSIIARFEPESSGHDLSGNSTNGIVILGAHQGEYTAFS